MEEEVKDKTERPDKPIEETYHDLVEALIDEKGIEWPQLLARHEDGCFSLSALAVGPEEAYKYMICLVASDKTISEAMMGIDRYTRPGQGNEYSDLIIGIHWRRMEPRKGTFVGFTIDYQFGPPKVVCPVNYDNHFWNEIVKNEFQHVSAVLQREASKRRLVDGV